MQYFNWKLNKSAIFGRFCNLFSWILGSRVVVRRRSLVLSSWLSEAGIAGVPGRLGCLSIPIPGSYISKSSSIRIPHISVCVSLSGGLWPTMSVLRQIPARIPPVSFPSLLPSIIPSRLKRSSLHKRPGIWFRFSVERHQCNTECDAWKVEKEAPPDGGPEPVEGVHDLVTERDLSGVEAVGKRGAESHLVF